MQNLTDEQTTNKLCNGARFCRQVLQNDNHGHRLLRLIWCRYLISPLHADFSPYLNCIH